MSSKFGCLSRWRSQRDRKMRDGMTNSIRKGKKFELKIAKLFTGLTGAKWSRVPNSGAMATAQEIKDRRFQGDIFTEDSRFFRWCVECKITGKPLVLAHLFNEKSLLWEWWKQTVLESGDKYPILVFQYVRGPVFAMTKMTEPLNELGTHKSIQIDELIIIELVDVMF